jgi:TonB-linked SusC/RagA family outer membrane protein
LKIGCKNGRAFYCLNFKNHYLFKPKLSMKRFLQNGIWLLFFLPSLLFAQTSPHKLTGQVVDEKTKAPLAGAGVHIKGTKQEVVTDNQGKFSLNANQQPPYTLIITYVGFQTRELVVDKDQQTIELKGSDSQLNDVVVVGYGTQRRSQVIGSVATVAGEELSKRSSPQLLQSIAGQMPGVTVIQRSGQPGAIGASIQIRGVGSFGAGTDPLVLIDGIPSTSINNVDPNDIESVSVLKDASSAAIYGARAASGVILITTKIGKQGKLRIGYTGYVGIQKPTVLPDYVSSAEYATLINEAQPGSYTDAQIAKFKDGSDPDNYPNTNWFKTVLKDQATQTGHNISITNGN